MPVRIAMWSGPRNISTAMMRSWGNRPDTFVCDEPFYAYFLKATGMKDHPGTDEVIAHHETDWRKVVDLLTGPVPGGKAVFYQKQMTHHFLPAIDRSWLSQVTNCFLIRDPRETLTSYIKFRSRPTIEDLGYPQQLEIFQWVCERTGAVAPVLDAREVLLNPRGMIERLCDVLQLDFNESMLAWPPGHRDTDGVWGKYWYKEVENSTSFRPYRPKSEQVPDDLKELCNRCIPFYEAMYSERLTC